MPIINIGNIRITTTFKTSLKYGKSGALERTTYLHTSYMNTATKKTASNADLAKVGIRKRQAPTVKLTEENADFLFTRAMRAEAGEISGKNFGNLLSSPSFGMNTEAQKIQFQQALKDMFLSSNPSESELREWSEMIDSMTPDECQEFYQRYQKDLKAGFSGYHSTWSSTDSDPLRKWTGRSSSALELQKKNRDEIRPRLLNAASSFLKSKGRQMTLDVF